MVSRTGYVGMFGVSLLVMVTIGGCSRETPVATPTVAQEPQEATVEPRPTQVPVSTPSSPATTYYSVQAGDTLWAIAGRFEVTVESLVEVNEGLEASRLQLGQDLVIPIVDDEGSDDHFTLEPSPEDSANLESQRIHTVTGGETLWGIALRYGTTVDEIARLNEVESDQLLMVGQRLSVP